MKRTICCVFARRLSTCHDITTLETDHTLQIQSLINTMCMGLLHWASSMANTQCANMCWQQVASCRFLKFAWAWSIPHGQESLQHSLCVRVDPQLDPCTMLCTCVQGDAQQSQNGGHLVTVHGRRCGWYKFLSPFIQLNCQDQQQQGFQPWNVSSFVD